MGADDKRSFPVRIRAHTLLCFQGFRGLGYSKLFVANMTAIHHLLQKEPETLVCVICEPDQVCQACPNLQPNGCALHGEGTESAMVAQDTAVLKQLGLQAGEILSWRAILARIARNLSGADLPKTCGHCPWLHLGYCAEGIEGLKG